MTVRKSQRTKRARGIKSVTIATLLVLAVPSGATADLSSDGPLEAPPTVGLPTRFEAVGSLERTRRLVRTGTLSNALRAAAQLADVEIRDDRSPAPGSIDEILVAIGRAARVSRTYPAAAQSVAGLPAVGPIHGDEVRPTMWLRRWADEHQGHGAPADLASLYEAAFELASTIDRALPGLKRMARSAPPAEKAEGCDVVDQLPRLCIGGTGSNTYDQDAELLIDLGGDDRHLNSAGGADPDLGNGLQVSITIDLDGDDAFEAATPMTGGARLVQGAAADGGIGFLVDVAGDDAYSIASKPIITAPDSLGAFGQGAAVSGVGLLADLEGNDTFDLISRGPGAAEGAFGQGAGSTGGMGIFVDGGGDDAYRVKAQPVHILDQDRIAHPRAASASAWGVGIIGTGMFADAGGSDRMQLTSVTMAPRGQKNPNLAGAGAGANGLGVGALGSGIALLGPGESKVSISSQALVSSDDREAVVAATSLGYGAGLLGYGGLHDAGGDDRYSIAALSPAAEFFGSAATITMGAGYQGAGALIEAGGNDRYDAVARARAGASSTVTVAQAAGLTGAGFLLDHSGDDRYSATGRADAVSAVADDVTFVQTYAQGAAATGVAELDDLSGSDRYSATAHYLLGPSGQEMSKVNGYVSAQASVDSGIASFFDLDTGEKDSFHTYPLDPVCQGERGVGEWDDCGDFYGRGRAREVP